jgi:hypothetical protein
LNPPPQFAPVDINRIGRIDANSHRIAVDPAHNDFDIVLWDNDRIARLTV